MNRDPSELYNWEEGEKAPSYTALEELAYRHFKIPLAVFFFPEPPELEDPVRSFRRLPEHEFKKLSSDTLHKIRMSQAYQDSLVELIPDSRLVRQIWRDIKSQSARVEELASDVRDYLDISLKQQFQFSDYEVALKAWRHAIEDAWVYTFKGSLKDRFISGFCLLHKQFPIIMIHNSTAFPRQIFTLIHELGHILFGVNGSTDIDESYIDYMNSNERSLEVKIN